MRELPRALKLTSRLHAHTGSFIRHSGIFPGIHSIRVRSLATDGKETGGDKKNTSEEDANNKKQKDTWDRMQSTGQWLIAAGAVYAASNAANQFFMNKNFELNMKKVDRGVALIAEFDHVSKELNALRQKLFELSYSNSKGEFKEKDFIELRGKVDELTSDACRIILYRHTDVIDERFQEVVAKEFYPALMQVLTALWDFENKKTFSPKDTILSCYSRKDINYDSSFREKSDYVIYIIKITHVLIQIARKEVKESLQKLEKNSTSSTSNIPSVIRDSGTLPNGALAMTQTDQYMNVETYINERIKALQPERSIKPRK